jgi:mRNA (guanine-N7-)-methyltransferase
MKGALSPKKDIVGGGERLVATGLLTGSLAAHDDGLESPQQATQMPGFDPVRDAVLNSPVTRSPTIPRHYPPPSTSAAISPNNASAPTAQAPRRATVAALLNDTSPSPSSSFHPPSLPVRASSLAHILHPNPPDDPPRFPSPEERLSRVSSLGRRSSEASIPDFFRASSLPSGTIHPAASPLSPSHPEVFTPTTERASGLFTPTVEQRGHIFPSTVPTSPTSSRLNLSRPSTSSSTSHRPPPSPVMPRPSVSRARSPSPQRPPSPPPKPKPLPYQPRRRTPAGSVLEPLTSDEMHFYRTQLGQGTRRLAKRRRSPSYEPPDAPAAKKSRDAGLVMNHCTLSSSLSE